MYNLLLPPPPPPTVINCIHVKGTANTGNRGAERRYGGTHSYFQPVLKLRISSPLPTREIVRSGKLVGMDELGVGRGQHHTCVLGVKIAGQ